MCSCLIWQVLEYASRMEQLALRLLPAFALALDLPEDYFTPAFADPLFRLRLSRYPPVDLEPGQFGIAPHVDTTFFTLLAQDGAGGLCVQAPQDGRWLSVPALDKHLVVNTGELLRQWSNHRVPSTRHYAVNTSGTDRYSLPFFFNATASHTMTCLPSCTSPDNPPRYPPMSFLESQGIAQGE
jgi:isopenicillin N synthase-like dioxygenase